MPDRKRSLQFQASCIRHLTAMAESEEIRSGAEAAIASLEWVSKGELVLKELIRLRKEQPELFQVLCNLFTAFPGAELAAVRDIQSERIGL